MGDDTELYDLEKALDGFLVSVPGPHDAEHSRVHVAAGILRVAVPHC